MVSQRLSQLSQGGTVSMDKGGAQEREKWMEIESQEELAGAACASIELSLT